MANLFPNSNLSTASQPWGREVEKRLVNLDLTVKSNEINNSARDIQLANSLTRVNSALLKAQTAIDSILSVEEAVYYPGTTEIDGGNIRANTIAANKISAGELVGFDIKTATTGQRVQMASNRIDFYDSLNAYSGGMFGVSYPGLGSGISIDGSIGVSGTAGFNGAVTMLSGLGVTGAISATTSISASGSLSSGSGLSVTSGGAVISNPGGAVGGNFLQVPDTYVRAVASGRIMYVSSAGTYNCSTSSARYKQDITPYQVDINKLLMLEPVSFRYKQAVEELGDAADVAHGFIAEQADEIGLTEFVDYEPDEEGNLRPDNFRYIDFTAALLGVVKQLNTRLTALENK